MGIGSSSIFIDIMEASIADFDGDMTSIVKNVVSERSFTITHDHKKYLYTETIEEVTEAKHTEVIDLTMEDAVTRDTSQSSATPSTSLIQSTVNSVGSGPTKSSAKKRKRRSTNQINQVNEVVSVYDSDSSSSSYQPSAQEYFGFTALDEFLTIGSPDYRPATPPYTRWHHPCSL